MKSPRPGTSGIYNIVSSNERLYRQLKYEMRGWYRFCSGGVIAGVMGQSRLGSRNRPERRKGLDMDLLQIDIPKKVYTIQDYFDRVDSAPIYRSGGTHFDLPIEYNYAAVLASIFYKWKTGQGGNEMWAGNSMNAKTFGIADKERTTKVSLSCLGFGQYLDDLAEKGIVRCTKLTHVAGAHGGHCTTWLACIRDDETEEYLEDILDKINGHLQYLARYKKYCRYKYNEEIHQERTEDQMITDLWEE